MVNKSQLQHEGMHSPHEHPQCAAQVTEEAVPLDPIGNLLKRPLYQAWETYQLCLIHRNKHGSSQNEETKKQGPNERTVQNFRKKAKQN